jgi:hypothetical protein
MVELHIVRASGYDFDLHKPFILCLYKVCTLSSDQPLISTDQDHHNIIEKRINMPTPSAQGCVMDVTDNVIRNTCHTHKDNHISLKHKPTSRPCSAKGRVTDVTDNIHTQLPRKEWFNKYE